MLIYHSVLSSAAEICEAGEARKTLLSAALEVLAGRVADRAAAVRGKSLQLLASVLTTNDAIVEPLAIELMSAQGEKLCDAAEERMTEASAAVRRGAVDLLAALLVWSLQSCYSLFFFFRACFGPQLEN